MQNFLPIWFHLDFNYYYYSFKRRLKWSWLSRFTSHKFPFYSFYSEIGTNESPIQGQLNMKLLTTHFVTKRWCDSNLAPFCVLVMEIWCEAFMESICPALPSHEHPAQNLLSSQNSCQIFSSSQISCQICCNNKIIQHRKTNIISSSLVTYNHYCFEPQWN